MLPKLVVCFPPLDPICVRSTSSSAPVAWTPCRGLLNVTEDEAIRLMAGTVVPSEDDEQHKRVSYRCPKLQNTLLPSGELEIRRCTVCTRKDRVKSHKLCKFNCEARFDAMIPRSDRDDRTVHRDIYSERVLRAMCIGGMRLNDGKCLPLHEAQHSRNAQRTISLRAKLPRLLWGFS